MIDPKAERVSLVLVVDAEDETTTSTLCTLSKDLPQCGFSILIPGEAGVTLKVVGNGSICVCGTTEDDPNYDEDLDEDEDDEDMDEDLDEDDEEEENGQGRVEEIDDEDDE